MAELLWSAWSDCAKILIPYGDIEGRANLTEAIDNYGCEAIKIFAQSRLLRFAKQTAGRQAEGGHKS